MKEYQVEIRETLSRIVTVEAEVGAEAYDIVKQRYRDQGIVLDAEDFQNVEFEVI